MSKGRELLPDNKEERDLLSKISDLAPLLTIILKILELALKILKVIR